MKKILKGFTLIELIIVMAIITILMSAVMNMFKPIRETFVDSTLYETQRTAQNGIIQYITESVRYSTDLGMYTMNQVGDIEGACAAFTDAYLEAKGVKNTDPNYSTKRANTLAAVKTQAEVIIIDQDEFYAFNGEACQGRVLRRKFVKDASGNVQQLTGDAEDISTNECRLALGAAYYGDGEYSISFDITQDAAGKGKAEDGIKVNVSSFNFHGNRQSKVVSNTGLVLCKNHIAPIKGMFDTVKFDPSGATGRGTKVYIVYINDTIEIV